MPEENVKEVRVTRSSQRQSQRLLRKKDMASVNDRKPREKEPSPSSSSSSRSSSSSSSSSRSPSPAKATFKKRASRTKDKTANKNSVLQVQNDLVEEKSQNDDSDKNKVEENEDKIANIEEAEKVKNDSKEEGEMTDEKEEEPMDQDQEPEHNHEQHHAQEEQKHVQQDNDVQDSSVLMEHNKLENNEDKSDNEVSETHDILHKKAETSKPSFRLTKRRISLSVHSKEGESSESQEQQQRRRRWGSSSKKMPSTTSLSISTDALKDLIPDYKPPAVPVLEDLSQDPLEFQSESEEAVSEKKEEVKKTVPVVKTPELEKTVEAPMEEETKSMSPSRNPPSCIVYIRNLVRPFTVQQLKNLLSQTGRVVETGFWIDKIKSKCYVTYETEDQAVETRAALHRARWPASNPKTLIVDFATKDELEFHQKLGDKPIIKTDPIVSDVPSPTVDYVESGRRELRRQDLMDDLRRREEREERRRERERKRERSRDVPPPVAPPIREWDRDKISQDDQDLKEKTRGKDKSAEKKDRRDKKESKKKQEEDTPAKLLDDLFRKTKTTPCIYWLPLTEEQIRKQAEERKQREIEREKRRKQHQLQLEQAQKEREEKREKERRARGGRDKESGRRSRSRSRSPAGRRR